MDPSAPAPDASASGSSDAGGSFDIVSEAALIAQRNPDMAKALDAEMSVTFAINEDGSVDVSSGSVSMTIRPDELLADDPDDDGDEAALAAMGVTGG